MNNLIKSEIYKLIHSKVFRNSVIIMSVVSLIVMFSKSESDGSGMLNLVYCGAGERFYGFVIGRGSSMISIGYLYDALGGIGIVLIISIFIVGASVVNEYISGTIKNSIAYGRDRVRIYVSKVIGTSVVVMGIATCFILFCILGSTIFYGWGESVTFSRISEIIRIIIVVDIALGCVISINMCLAFMTKSKALLVVVFLVIMISTWISIGINISPALRFNPYFMLMDICSEVPAMKLMVKYAINCLGLIAVSTLAGVVFFKNEDIK